MGPPLFPTIRKPSCTPLENVSRCAINFGVNLNNYVSRDDTTMTTLIGANAIVQRGKLHTDGRTVAVKTIRFVPLETKAAVEVIITYVIFFWCFN